jgi:hypothetical protein
MAGLESLLLGLNASGSSSSSTTTALASAGVDAAELL